MSIDPGRIPTRITAPRVAAPVVPRQTDRRWYAVPRARTRTEYVIVAAGQQIDGEQRTRIVSWLRDNGIDPDTVMQSGDLIVETRTDALVPEQTVRVIRYRECLLTPQGQKIRDPYTGDALTADRTVLLIADLPAQPTGGQL